MVQVVDQRLHEHIRVTVNLRTQRARARLRDFDATVVELLERRSSCSRSTSTSS